MRRWLKRQNWANWLLIGVFVAFIVWNFAYALFFPEWSP